MMPTVHPSYWSLSLSILMVIVGCSDGASSDPETGNGETSGVPAPGDTTNSTGDPAIPIFEIGNVDDTTLGQFFSKSLDVFGVTILASESTPDTKVLHAAHVMAEYLDNNEDGAVDDQAVIDSLVREKATLVMFATEEEAERSGIFDADIPEDRGFQDLYGEETNQPNRFDAALEEVLHLISHYGYERVYPASLGTERPTRLTDAMDLARGGYFETVPTSYPDGAWYHYDDVTCDYRCMAVEYFYWALTTKLGAQSDTDRCADIIVEWELCTPEALASGDPAIQAILEDASLKLPTVLPDGSYRGN